MAHLLLLQVLLTKELASFREVNLLSHWQAIEQQKEAARNHMRE